MRRGGCRRRRGVCACLLAREQEGARASGPARERPGEARRLGSPPRRARSRQPERVGQRLALPADGPPAAPPAARRPPPPRAPAQPEPARCSSSSASSPPRAADRQPPRGECRYFAFRIICRTPASLRSAQIFSCPRPLPPEKRIPLLKQAEPPKQKQQTKARARRAAVHVLSFLAVYSGPVWNGKTSLYLTGRRGKRRLLRVSKEDWSGCFSK